MTDILTKKCELFDRNRIAISKKFISENTLMSIAASLLFTAADKDADIEKLTDCRNILKNHTGFFSEYRNIVEIALISEMTLSHDAEQYIEDVKEVYQKLRKGKLQNNSYMVLAAMLMCDIGKQDRSDEILEKYNEIIKNMEKLHPILTDSKDISYVILLALSNRPVDTIISDMNECFDYLKKTCKIKIGSDSIQELSEILALKDGDMKEKCDNVIKLYNTLKEKKAAVGDGAAFSSLGTLIDIDEKPEIIINEILKVDKYLKGCKGFNEESVNKKQRLLFAEILVAQTHGAGTAMLSNAFINSTINVIIAQRISAIISIISNVLPAAIGSVIEQDSK